MAVVESKIPVGSTGLNLDSAQVNTSQGAVEREAVFIGDPETPAARQKVTNADPGGGDYGGVVRIAGTVPLSTGAATAARQDTEIAGLASILSELGGKTEPADQQHVIVDAAALPSATAVSDQRLELAAAGVPIQFPAGAAKEVTVVAEPDNEGVVVIGAATVIAAEKVRRGVPLWPGDSASFEVSNLNLLYMDGRMRGDAVTYAVLG